MNNKKLQEIWNQRVIKKEDLSDFDFSQIQNYDSMTKRQLLWHLIQDKQCNPGCKNYNCSNDVNWNPATHCYQSYCSSKCANQDTEKKQKYKKTMLERYGAESPWQNQEIKERMKKTMVERYGVDNASKYDDIIEKRKKTNLEKYGTEHATQNISVKNKTKITNLKKYGTEYFLQSDYYRDVMSERMIKIHGVDHYSKSTEFKNRMKRVNLKSSIHFDKETSEILFSRELLKEFAKGKTKKQMAELLNVDPTTIHNYLNDYKIVDYEKQSYLENEMRNFLFGIGIEILENSRLIIPPKELDFYLPQYKVAIEMNGDYWHSHEKLRDERYHYNKWRHCQEQGIHLIQILESDWNQNQEKFKSLIHTLIGRKVKGDSARKCQIQQIDAPSARPFLEKYHLQGFVAGTSHWGAYDSSEQLVGVMTFGWTRGNKKSRRFELKRWATDNQSHAGLFSKTFKSAQQILGFDQVVSFSMNDWFTGNVYEKCGFTKGKLLPPGYSYLYNNKKTHLSNFTKQRIREKFPEFYNEKLTEREMMDQMGIACIYDSGKTEWIWNSHSG